MKFLKAGTVGLIASLVTFFLVKVLIIVGWAPFNLYPHAALLTAYGVNFFYLPLILYLCTGIFWSLALAWLFQKNITAVKGLVLGVCLWLFFNLNWAPLIGWGLFGYQGTPELGPKAALYLRSGLPFLVVTICLYLIYGGLVGWLNQLWLDFSGNIGDQIRKHSTDS